MTRPPWSRRLYQLIGQRIRDVREDSSNALPQKELAERTGGFLSRSTIANIETGYQRVALDQLFALADALGVEPRHLIPARSEVLGIPRGSPMTRPDGMTADEARWLETIVEMDVHPDNDDRANADDDEN